MTRSSNDRLVALLREIELPDRAYEKAESRYQSLAQWFSRPGSELQPYDAHLFVQGSFSLGTSVRPISPEEEYDLDFTCKLRRGVTRQTHSQADLKALLGREMAAYRIAQQIQKPLEPKTRCWRLSYQDAMPFHMDVVPGLRVDDVRRKYLSNRMLSQTLPMALAEQIARRALWITDDTLSTYPRISDDWPSSNPGGYQQWFLSRMQQEDPSRILAKAHVDPMPVYRGKSALQQTVQLLKRHRDVQFSDDPDLKPSSIIITTIAAHAHVSGDDLTTSLHRALAALEQVRASDTNSILNPVEPDEDFADRWRRADLRHLNLKGHFHDWISAARSAFHRYLIQDVPQRLLDGAYDDFRVGISGDKARALTGASVVVPSAPTKVALATTPAAPWAE